MKEHLIFFDATCSLCQRSVQTILQLDKHKKFLFAPLSGRTADKVLSGARRYLKNENTLILVESNKKRRVWIRARAVFRIFWLLGGFYKLLGLLCFVPWIFDGIYAWIARKRHYFLKKSKRIMPSQHKDRFLS